LEQVIVIKSLLLKYLFVFGVTFGLILGCGFALVQPSQAYNPLQGKVEIAGTDITGNLSLIQLENGLVKIRGEIHGDPGTLTPGLHGLHIHAVGVCEQNAQPPFSTSGGHYDPGPYSSELPVEANHPYHLGDLPNLVVDQQGYATYNATTRVTLSESPLIFFDNNGSAIIIHQQQDQQKAGGTSAEAGGGRIACGVVTQVLD
jgi:Cu-Zn family superoxide dismutase